MTGTHKPGIGAIFGIVTEEGVVKPNSPVYLLDMRRNEGVAKGRVLAKQVTDGAGGFVFNGLNKQYAGYAVFATDEDGAEPKNALIQDRVLPVAAQQGSTWFVNWWTQAVWDGAVSILGYYPLVGTPPDWFIPGANGSDVLSLNNAADFSLMNIVPGAPHIPGVGITPTSALMVPGSWIESSTAADMELTLEWVVDFGSFSGTHQPACCLGGNNHFGAFMSSPTDWNRDTTMHTMFGMFINPVTKVVEVRVANANVSQTHYIGTKNETALLLSHDLSAQTGPTHLAAVYTPGAVTRLYVNGVEAASFSPSPTFPYNPYGNDRRWLPQLLIGGESTGNRTPPVGASYVTGPAAVYNRALSAAEVLTHYQQLLLTTVAPVATGYVKAVMQRTPLAYYRLNEALVDHLNPAYDQVSSRGVVQARSFKAAHPVLNTEGAITPLGPSPITGGNSLTFTGEDYLRNALRGMLQPPSPNELSIGCWVNFSVATPASIEHLFTQFILNSPNVRSFELRRNTNGELALVVRQAGVQTTYTFTTYTPPTATWLYVSVRFDIRDVENTSVQLFIATTEAPPALQESLVASPGQLYSAKLNPVSITTQPYSRIEIGQNFVGSLTEIAVFPYALTEADMLGMWDARLIP